MKKNVKYIHIHAKCNYFEIFEIVPESRSVERLSQIRNNYVWFKKHKQEVLPKRKKGSSSYDWSHLMPSKMDNENKLSVKTQVVNPEFNFYSAASPTFL